jgi:hypothetical protein
MTHKKWYQFFRIHFNKWDGKVFTCGDTDHWPSAPRQYYIYSEKTGKVLYVNTSQDPYHIDPTSIEF